MTHANNIKELTLMAFPHKNIEVSHYFSKRKSKQFLLPTIPKKISFSKKTTNKVSFQSL